MLSPSAQRLLGMTRVENTSIDFGTRLTRPGVISHRTVSSFDYMHERARCGAGMGFETALPSLRTPPNSRRQTKVGTIPHFLPPPMHGLQVLERSAALFFSFSSLDKRHDAYAFSADQNSNTRRCPVDCCPKCPLSRPLHRPCGQSSPSEGALRSRANIVVESQAVNIDTLCRAIEMQHKTQQHPEGPAIIQLIIT
jgi:hypothetical protein